MLRFEPRPLLNLGMMLTGTVAVSNEDRIVATSQLTGEARALSEIDLRVLGWLSSNHWTPLSEAAGRLGIQAAAFDPLLEAGLVIGDADDARLAELRSKEDRLRAMDWDDFAVQYHVMSRVRDVNVAEGLASQVPGPMDASGPEAPQELPAASEASSIEQYYQLTASLSQGLAASAQEFGPPPHHFHDAPQVRERHDLPIPRAQSHLIDLLMRRQTIRIFDEADPMTADELSTVLYYTFGCQAYAQLIPGLTGLRKTSPSGGALHPIEAYPLVLNVAGVPNGIYHYNVRRHGLDLIQPLSQAEAEGLAESFTLGQSYFRSAHVLFILTARWYRNFWKYRKAPKSYRVIHVDAGHLSQTLYLLATDLGLGAFYTGAINDMNIEDALGIDGLEEGVIGVSGCGRPWKGGSPLALQPYPYNPELARINPEQ